jgi:hypothetical protein
MADAMVLLDEAGPLPLSVNFDAEVDGPVVFVLSGTAWTQHAPTMIGINLLLDGEVIGSAATGFANLNANHQAMRTTLIPYDGMTVGQHTIEVAASSANPNTVTDFNDIFQVTMLY